MVTLVVPGSSERMLDKARALPADELVVDLEDAVVPERKPEALQNALAFAADPDVQAATVAVRVNQVGTPWVQAELVALAGSARAALTVVVPKVESPGDLAFVDDVLSAAERASGRDTPIGVQALIETAAGVQALPDVVRASDRLQALILGYADLAASLGRATTSGEPERWLAIQDAVLIAARAAGLRAIDGPFLDVRDLEALRAATRHVADLGFDGKWAIHPAQLEVIARELAPRPEELEHARQVLKALERAAAEGGGAALLDGKMIDEPIRLAALRTLQRAGETH